MTDGCYPYVRVTGENIPSAIGFSDLNMPAAIAPKTKTTGSQLPSLEATSLRSRRGSGTVSS